MIHPKLLAQVPAGVLPLLYMGFVTESEVLASLRRNRSDKRTGTPDNCHRHKCPKCKLVWFHVDDLDERVNFFAHHIAHCCPSCHTEQFEKYGGRLMPICQHIPVPEEPVRTGSD